MRIAEVDIDIGGQFQALMIGQFLSAIPREGLVELPREFLGLLDQGRDDAFGILVRDFEQHHIPGMAFDQRGDVAVLRPPDQIALPLSVIALQSTVGSDAPEWHGLVQMRAFHGSTPHP